MKDFGKFESEFRVTTTPKLLSPISFKTFADDYFARPFGLQF